MVVALAPISKLRPHAVRLARGESHCLGGGALIQSSLSAGRHVYQPSPRPGPANVVETGKVGLVRAWRFDKLAATSLFPPACDQVRHGAGKPPPNGATQN
jgi:hypothetical protein